MRGEKILETATIFSNVGGSRIGLRVLDAQSLSGAYPPSVLPDISPSRGEIDSWLALRFRSGPIVWSKTPLTGDGARACRTAFIRGLTPLCPAGHLPLKGGDRRTVDLRSRSGPIVLSKTPLTGDGARACRTVFIRGSTPLCPAGHLPLKGGDRQNGRPSLQIWPYRA